MKSGLWSPSGFLRVAAGLGMLYGAAHLLGLRDDTSILSGTTPPGGAAGAALGLVYVALHFACVIGSPILVLAAALFWGLDRATRTTGPQDRAPGTDLEPRASASGPEPRA